MNHQFSARLELATVFPGHRGQRGASTTILDLQRYARAGTYLASKFAAVSLIVRAGFERVEGRGVGNRADRRTKGWK